MIKATFAARALRLSLVSKEHYGNQGPPQTIYNYCRFYARRKIFNCYILTSKPCYFTVYVID